MKQVIWVSVFAVAAGVSATALADTGTTTGQPYVPAGGYETTSGTPPPGGATGPTAPATGTAAIPAGAQRWPTRFVERGLTIPEMTLSIDAEFFYLKLPSVDFGGMSVEPDPIIGLVVGAGFGIMENFEVGATVLPLLLSPEADYGDPSIYAIYRFLTGDVEVGGAVGFTIPVQDGTDPTLTIGVPVVVHVGNFGRLNTGLFYSGIFGSEECVAGECVGGFTYGWSIPLEYYFNFTDEFFAGLDLAFSWSEFDFDPSLTIPLFLRLGYTIAGPQGPIADISGFFGWPLFLRPLVGDGGDSVTADIFTFGLTGRVFIYL